MSALRLSAGVLEAIRAHGGERYPEECCGALLGPAPQENGPSREVVRARPIENHHPGERERRYLIGPDDLMRVEAEAEEAGLAILGFYHSHPDHPAEPSETDRSGAWPWYHYLILPVRRGAPGRARAWRLRDDRSAFDEVEVAITSVTGTRAAS